LAAPKISLAKTLGTSLPSGLSVEDGLALSIFVKKSGRKVVDFLPLFYHFQDIFDPSEWLEILD
jgi:hypothetical protein